MNRKRPDCWRLRGQDSLPNTNKHLPLGPEEQKADGGRRNAGAFDLSRRSRLEGTGEEQPMERISEWLM